MSLDVKDLVPAIEKTRSISKRVPKDVGSLYSAIDKFALVK